MKAQRYFIASILLAGLGTASACAQDPAMVRWERELAAVERIADGDTAQPARAMAGYGYLQRTALKPVDRQLLTMRKARLHNLQGRTESAMTLYQHVALSGLRRMDRARAAYEMVRIIEDRGETVAALAGYRRLALTYPALMPGLRGLAHAQRLLYAQGLEGVDAHLNWMFAHFPVMKSTELGDNFLYAAAVQGRARAKEAARGKIQQRELLAASEAIYRRIDAEYYRKGLWLESVWELSYLLQEQGRWQESITTIRKVFATKETGGLFGDSLHQYFRIGRWRIARMAQKQLKDPAAALAELGAFMAEQPMSRFRDDARFYQGCLQMQMGDAAAAEASWAMIAKEYDESKFLRRVPVARKSANDPICDLPMFEEGS